MGNGNDLSFIQGTPLNQVDGNGSRWLFLLTHKHRLLRCGKMNARRSDRPQVFNGTRQLSLKRPLIINLFAKLANTKLFLIQQFKPYGAAFWQPLLGQLHTHFMDLPFRNQNSATRRVDAVRDIHLRQLGNNGPTVFITDIAKQHAIAWLFCPEHKRN